MATVSKCGSSGSVSLGGEVSQWEVNLEEDIPDVTSMASGGYVEVIPCLKSASGSFTTYVPCGAIGVHAGVDFVNDIETISMDIIITDLTCTTDVADKVVFKYSFVSNGEVIIS